MARARAVAPVGFATGQEALEKVAETVAALIEARGAMAGCHSALA
jgi:quinol monooxygenase YgiN